MFAAMAQEIKHVYDLLKVSQESMNLFRQGGFVISPKEKEPEKLPVAPTVQLVEDAQFTEKPTVKPGAKTQIPTSQTPLQTKASWLQKDFIKYPLIFVVSFALFYFFLNFGAFSAKIGSYFESEEPQAQTQGQVLGVATPEYASWINKYFYQTNNNDSLSPNVDFDRDGLTGYQEFLLGTNPTKQDTDNDNYGDGREILNGYNPLNVGKLTPNQQDAVREWDLRDINNRISYYAITKLAAGPAKPSDLPAINYNLQAAGELFIPKLGVRAPVIWSRSPDNFAADLEQGLIHYPGTSLPGQAGVAYLSGHSSNYIWSRSKYSYVFTRINELEPGDEFFVTVHRADGEKLNLRYVVFGQNEYQPEDQAQFISSGLDSIVNLSTCWPLGSTARRLVVSAKLTGV